MSGEEAVVTALVDVRLPRAEPLGAGLVAPELQQRLDFGHALLGSGRGGGIGRTAPRQRRRISARVGIGQGLEGPRGVVHRVGVGPGQDIHRRPGGGSGRSQAVETCVELVAALHLERGPLGGERVEPGVDLRPGRLGVGELRVEDRGADPLPIRLAPDLGMGRPCVRARAARLVVGEHSSDHAARDGDARGDEAPPRWPLLQRVEQLLHRREAARDLLRQPAAQRLHHGARHRPTRAHLDPARTRVGRQLLHRLALDRPLAEQGLVQRDAERELIRARVVAAPDELLRSHVRRRAQGVPGLGELLVAPIPGDLGRSGHRRIDGARQAEVEHPHASVVGEHHVVRLEVAVDQPLPVRRGQPPPRLDEGAQDRGNAAL